MSLAQVHYTSAAPGDEGTAGRFTAVGPGVSAALLAEIEPLLRHELPDGVADRPSDGELRSLPQPFTYATLSDGSRLVSRSAPVRDTAGGAGRGSGSTRTRCICRRGCRCRATGCRSRRGGRRTGWR
ncbi:hypothetical protein GA0115253_1033019 [Streptomyces sp. Termitarium-T10T-6]|nr:hypothetical protein GA0115253_1033019 [Streptomyces sp. Termitarium-T10T-6]